MTPEIFEEDISPATSFPSDQEKEKEKEKEEEEEVLECCVFAAWGV